MTVTVKNGERREVCFRGRRGGYHGPAAVECPETGPWRIRFAAPRSELSGAKDGIVGGVPVRVLGLGESGVVRGVLVLTVEPQLA